jgi:hypothetical protein
VWDDPDADHSSAIQNHSRSLRPIGRGGFFQHQPETIRVKHMKQHTSQPARQQASAPAAQIPNSFQNGTIGLAAVAAAAEQMKPKTVKRPEHPLPACLRDQG